MAVHGGAREERPWSDLPGDLLAAVYLRSASAYDRARFAAVCSPWRAVAAWHPRLPALPLLLPSTDHGKHDKEAQAYSPEDGRALRVPLPWFPCGSRLVGSYEGGWIAAVSSSDELLVVNLFSGARPVFTSDCSFIRRIVFSKDPSSGDCIIAAMASGCRVAVRRVDSPDSGWTMHGFLTSRYGDLLDIAFCNGVLYGVSFGALIVFDTGRMNKEDALMAWVGKVNVAMRTLYDGVPSAVKHIFQLHDKLAVAVELVARYGGKERHFFKVFELADAEDDTTTSCSYTWEEVKTLGDHALFLGPGYCKAVHIPTADQRGRVEGNHIYYSKQHNDLDNKVECLARLDMGSCTVHCWGSEDNHHLEMILSQRYYYVKNQDDANDCVWLWPPDI